ncbi:hypothetical protein EMCRGX_G020568 [Ephydatia muelleri]|eukprot:Em0016g538a
MAGRPPVVLADEKSMNLKVFCQLCNRIYREPYITSCGHTFCKECVTNSTTSVCPYENTSLTLVVKNLTVAEQVGDLTIHCQYGCKLKQDDSGQYEIDPEGCPITVKLGSRHKHETECEFASVECPNSSVCGRVMRKCLDEHLKNCNNTACPHLKYGCPFQGRRDELEHHLATCKFEGIKAVLNTMDKEINALNKRLEEKVVLVGQLSATVVELNSKIDRLDKNSAVMKHRVEQMEEKHSDIQKDMIQAKGIAGKMAMELALLQQQQLGLAPNMELQHIFKCQGTFVGHEGPVWALCTWGEQLFSASSDNTIKVWDLSASYTGPRTLTGHSGIVLALQCNGDVLFSGSSDSTIRVWKIKTLEMTASILAHDDPVCTLACSKNMLFSGSLRSIKVWDVLSYRPIKELPSQNHWVRALVVSGNYLYSGSYKTVKVWSLDTLEVLHVLQSGGGSVYSLVLTDKYIICGTYENLIQVWDLHSLKQVLTLTGHTGIVYALAILKAPGQTRLFSGSYDKSIRVWNLELMTCSQTLVRHEGSVTCLCVSMGRTFSGAVDSTIKVWV